MHPDKIFTVTLPHSIVYLLILDAMNQPFGMSLTWRDIDA
jgi:hypothetical protein